MSDSEYWRTRFENAREQRNTLLAALLDFEERLLRLERQAKLHPDIEKIHQEVIEEARLTI